MLITGTDGMVSKLFSPIFFAKNWRFLFKLLLIFYRNIGVLENAENFSPKIGKNLRKM
jgi:hypothetical protein